MVKWQGEGPQNLIGGSIPSRASQIRATGCPFVEEFFAEKLKKGLEKLLTWQIVSVKLC